MPTCPTPGPEDLLVIYLPDPQAWQQCYHRMLAAGFQRVTNHNPYWDNHGQTFTDDDGYLTVIQRGQWPAA